MKMKFKNHFGKLGYWQLANWQIGNWQLAKLAK
jgi:hypothetical protein